MKNIQEKLYFYIHKVYAILNINYLTLYMVKLTIITLLI